MTITALRPKATTLDTPEYAIKMTRQMFEQVFGGKPRDIGVKATTTGWNPKWYTLQLPCIKRHWSREGYLSKVTAITFYGQRSLYRLKEEGYHLAGRCKVEGQEVTGYTSDIMVEVEDRLFVIAVISIRGEA